MRAEGRGGRKHTWYLLSSREGTPRYRSEKADAVRARGDQLLTQIRKRSRRPELDRQAQHRRSRRAGSAAGLTVELPVRHWGHRTGTSEDAVGGLEHHQRQVCSVTLDTKKNPLKSPRAHFLLPHPLNPSHDPASLTFTCACSLQRSARACRSFTLCAFLCFQS